MTTARVIEKMPFAEYLKLPGENSTGLRKALVSPLEYRHAKDNPREDSDTLRVGRACHTAILEMDRFLLEYALYEGRRAGSKWDEFEAMNDGKTILRPDHYHTALAARDAVREHAIAGPLLKAKGRNELTIEWTHAGTGLACKSRIDRLCSALIDIKSARDVSPSGFGRAAANYGYVTQLAFYADAVAAAGLGKFPVLIVTVQSSAPHDVVVHQLTDDQLDQGRREYEKALAIVAECTKSGKWPGCAPDETIDLQLPAWAAPEFNEDALTMDGVQIF